MTNFDDQVRKGNIELEPGCYLDSHRGHYITRDMLWLAEGFGYIIDPCMKFVLAHYEDHCNDEDYPFEALTDEADAALAWLNGGPNEGPDRAIKFQNSPPVIPDGTAWGWNDGDFGLYPYVLFNIGEEDSNGTKSLGQELTHQEAEALLKEHGASEEAIANLLAQDPDDMAMQLAGFIVEAIGTDY